MNPLLITSATLPEMISRLTPRQLEIVGLLAEGHSNKMIATILSISRHAVKRHIYRACLKTELNRIQLIVMFVMWREKKDVTNPQG